MNNSKRWPGLQTVRVTSRERRRLLKMLKLPEDAVRVRFSWVEYEKDKWPNQRTLRPVDVEVVDG